MILYKIQESSAGTSVLNRIQSHLLMKSIDRAYDRYPMRYQMGYQMGYLMNDDRYQNLGSQSSKQKMKYLMDR